MLRGLIKPMRPFLLPFKNFFCNVLYLFKHNIALRNISVENINYYLDNIKFEIEDDLKSLKRPIVEDPLATINKIRNDKVSLARFGDGEFELLYNRPILFQKNSLELAERLQEILTSQQPNVAIGIPYYYWHTISNTNNIVKNFTRRDISRNRKEYEKHILFDKQYYATEFTQLYMTYSEGIDMHEYFESLKSIWQDRDITIIQGKGITKDFKYNIFENAKSIEYAYGPAKDAFFDYDNIFASALKIDHNRLVLIILGPTATVLAYDLAKAGYQALDIGHTAKDYDFYKKGINKTLDNLNEFYSPD
jgi:glycosyltransferase family protein